MLFNFPVNRIVLLWLLGSSTVTLGANGSPNANPNSTTDGASTIPADEEIIVHSQTVIAAKKKALENKLRRIGYKKFIRKKGRTVVRHARSYRPAVVLDDDGWIYLKRSPVRFEPPGKAAERSSKLKYLWCLPPFTVACVRIGGQLVSRRRLQSYKNKVASRSRSYVKDWQNAIVSHAMDQRLNTDIPNMLDLIWTQGLTRANDSLVIESKKERRTAILQFWANRTCIKEGDQARAVARDFILYEIQASEHPATASEINAVNTAQRCPNARPLPIPSDR
jgi:hypothetical protein